MLTGYQLRRHGIRNHPVGEFLTESVTRKRNASVLQPDSNRKVTPTGKPIINIKGV